MEQYNVTGMSCAACSARVEKAVKKVPGVTSCSVSLLTNSMGVEGTASPAAILSAVQEAGYGASPKSASASKAADTSADLDALADRETPKLKRRLIASLGFLLVLMYFSDGRHDVGLAPAPLVRWQPRRHGPCPAAAGGHRHGHQPEVLHQRLQGPHPRRTQHGYAGGPRLHGKLRVEHCTPSSP